MSKLKNTLRVFLFVFFLFQIVFVISTESSVLAEEIVYGDVNLDGEINSFDFAVMRMYLVGKIKEFESDKSIKAADVNGDGEFNSLDFALMKKYLLGKIKEFPVNQNSTPTPSVTATPTPTTSASEFTKVKPLIVNVNIIDLNCIELSWDKIEGAVSYEIFRDDVSIGTTSDTYFADLSVIESKEHVYKIKAVNDLGESSQYSSGVIVNTLDTVIDSDTVLSENRYYLNLSLENGAILDLNGFNLDIKGDFQSEGIVVINSGNLKVYGNCSINGESPLQMTNEEDYVFVGGNLAISDEYAGFYKEILTAGTLEVKGDINCSGFRASGGHKVILSGEEEQRVENHGEGIIRFNELEIRNERGVEIVSPIAINKMKGSYNVLGELRLVCDGIVEGDVEIPGDLSLEEGYLNLRGYCLSVGGNLIQGYEGLPMEIEINGGSLKIKGDYNMYGWSCLYMANKEDYVYIGGNLNVQVEDRVMGEMLDAGIIEVKGDINCSGFRASGGHKVILSGEEEQRVENHGEGIIRFNELEIRNERGVEIVSPIAINKMKGSYNVLGELRLVCDGIVEGDVEIPGDLSLEEGYLNLRGYCLSVGGNLIQGYEGLPMEMGINGGSLKINGDYNMYGVSVLEMTNESDYVYVGGNFTISSEVVHSNCLTAGTLEVKGNFTQSKSPLNFVASGSHKTILSGDTVQTVTFEYPETSSFNILKLSRPLDSGYIFNTTPVWKILEE